MHRFKVDNTACTRCGRCVATCSRGALSLNNEAGIVIDTTRCYECQHCFAVCPQAAISIFGLNPELDSTDFEVSDLPDRQSLELLLRARRSVRSYRQQNIDQETILRLLHTVANAPTAMNNRGLVFDVIGSLEKMHRFREHLMQSLVEYSQEVGFTPEQQILAVSTREWLNSRKDLIFRTAPHLLIISADRDNPVASLHDVIIALSYFELLATAHGIGTTWCGRLKYALELLPSYKKDIMSNQTSDYYCMLFGLPAVHFMRTVNRDNAARINIRL